MSTHGQSSPTPASAAVLEFICLFTHDLRRKQKRWQDGRLKYHTFNQRVMVYDDRGNSVGDMHWRRDYDFGEGEEVQLERGSVLVQVCELQQRTDQDLSELLGKRAKEKEQRQAQALARAPASNPVLPPRSAARPVAPAPASYSRVHRPLHQVLGTPSGHHGKALVPKESPFEQRHYPPVEPPEEQAAKRRKYEPPPSKSGYAQALFGQALTLSATPTSSVPVRRQAVYDPPPSSVEDEEDSPSAVLIEPKPPLREQPKSSRHFNHKVPENSDISSSNTEGGSSPGPVSKPRSIAHKENSTHRAKIPAEVEVIEIDDSEPRIPESRDRPTVQRPQLQKASKARSMASANSDSTGRARNKNGSNLQGNDDDEAQRPSGKDERPLKSKKSKPTAELTKASAKRTAESSAPANVREPDHGPIFKKRSEPTTELRIKPRKKRGLLILSEPLSKSSSEPEPVNSITKAASPQKLDGDDDDDLFRSPSSSQFAKESGANNGSPALKRSAQRDTSAVLEEDHSTAHPEPDLDEYQFAAFDDPAVEDHIENTGLADDIEPEDKPEADHELRKIGFENAPAVEPVNATLARPRGKVYDPYRLPSSSPEEASGLTLNDRCEPPEEPMTRKDGEASLKGVPLPAETRPRAAKLPPGRKQQRSRRKVVLEDDDEAELQPQTTSVEVVEAVEVSETIDHDSDLELLAPPKKPKKALKFLEKSNTHDSARGAENNSVPDGATEDARPAAEKYTKTTKRKSKEVEKESDPDSDTELPTKRQRGSSTKAKSPDPDSDSDQPVARRRKSKPKTKSPSPEPEDEQPTKRRRSTRKTRNQALEEEDTPLLSDHQDVSDREVTKKNARKKKAPEERPRLARIKKSVKSREIIGFNLAALNVPLGLRGIGMPFSILSSPVTESLEKRSEHQASMEMSSSPHRVDEASAQPAVAFSDPLETIHEMEEIHVDADVMVVEKAENESLSGTLGRQSPVVSAASEQVALGNLDSAFRPANSTSAEQSHEELDVSKGQICATLSAADNTIDDDDMQNSSAKAEPGAPEEVGDQKGTGPLHPSPLVDTSEALEAVRDDGTDDISLPAEVVSPQVPLELASGIAESGGIRKQQSACATADAEADNTVDRTKASAKSSMAVPSLGRQQSPTVQATASKKETNSSTSLGTLSSIETKETPAPDAYQKPNNDSKSEPSSGPRPRQKYIGLRRTASVTVNNISIERPPTEESSGNKNNNPSSVGSSTKPTARIANPASRGRKAALHSDAAGPVPQRLLPPTQPQMHVPISTADLAATQLDEELPKEKKEPEKPKRKMRFPGFQSARGEGPWSREAFDLLGSGRPE